MVAAQAQLAVDLVTADLSEVITLRTEEGVLQQGGRKVAGGLLARALLAVDLQQSLIGVGHTVGLEGGHHKLGEAEALADLLFRPPQSLEQHRHRLATLAVDTNADGVALVHVKLEPCTAGRDDLDGVERTLRGLIDGAVEVDARGTHQLGDDDTLGAVDDEGALLRHHREIADEHRLGLDLLGVVVDELCRHIKRRRVVNVLFLAFVDGVFHRLETRLRQGQRHIAGVVLDGRKLFQDVFQAAGHAGVGAALLLLLGAPLGRANEPGVGINLYVEEARKRNGFADFRERVTLRGSGNISH